MRNPLAISALIVALAGCGGHQEDSTASSGSSTSSTGGSGTGETSGSGTGGTEPASEPRIVVGTDDDAARKVLEDLYSPFIIREHKVFFMDVRSAEMTRRDFELSLPFEKFEKQAADKKTEDAGKANVGEALAVAQTNHTLQEQPEAVPANP